VRAVRNALVSFALGGAVAACNQLTGADAYSSTTSCTGDACEAACDLKGGTLQPNEECRCTCYQGAEDIPGKCPPGELTAPLCGDICCASLVCISDSNGNPTCGANCRAPLLVCGPVCCDAGETCLNPDVGACGRDYGKLAQSCAGGLTCEVTLAGGATAPADCCESVAIPGGEFEMGRSATGANACPPSTSCDPSEEPDHPVTLSPFGIDRFEVTVGRFRAFVGSWTYAIPEGAGGDSRLPYSGWQTGWNGFLPADPADLGGRLQCDPSTTWTSVAGANESKPMTCVSWYLAFVFCAWDGGRLPTEAEWELAAGNGAQTDLYPWGSAEPDATRAIYDASRPATVGTLPFGADAWDVRDLSGNVAEWVHDVFAPYETEAVTNYFFYSTAGGNFIRGLRGGSYLEGAGPLRAAARASTLPDTARPDVGFRCARRM
jgi:formylglycine-generating enzyme required for sulfatase activity